MLRARFYGFVSKRLRSWEGRLANLQGKGFGTATIEQEVKLVHSVLGKAPTLAVDVGGNEGNYTAELLRRTPSLEVHVFEPSKTNIQKLEARFRDDERVTIVAHAVSDRDGVAQLFADVPGSGLASLTKRRLEHRSIDFEFRESVTTIRVENYWSDVLRERPLDIVKLDIEGHELAALSGFGRALAATTAIQFEFGGCNIDTRTFFQDFWYFFTEHGFDVHRISPLGLLKLDRYLEADEFFSTTNYVAVNRRRR